MPSGVRSIYGANESWAADDQRRPDARRLVLAGHHDERLAAEELLELSGYGRHDVPPDSGGHVLDSGTALHGKFTLVEHPPVPFRRPRRPLRYVAIVQQLLPS
jgi:hypothetical protein